MSESDEEFNQLIGKAGRRKNKIESKYKKPQNRNTDSDVKMNSLQSSAYSNKRKNTGSSLEASKEGNKGNPDEKEEEEEGDGFLRSINGLLD